MAALLKFALYLGILGAAGTVFATAAVGLDRYRRLSLGFAFLGLAATFASFSLRAGRLTGDLAGMTDPEMLGLLWTTPVGVALGYRLIGLALLILGLLLRRGGTWLSCLGAGLALWSFDHIGHVPDLDTTLLDVALTFHLAALAFWIGILVPLRHLATHSDTHADAARVGHRFGRIAVVTVPLLIVAGGYMAYVLVGSFVALFATAYGQMLILKIALVAGLLALAAANKLRFIPGMQQRQPQAAAQLRTSLTVEIGIVTVILAVTALLTSTLTLPT